MDQAFPDPMNDDDDLDDSPREGAWELALKRDFNGEVQTYLENKRLREQ